ncbi:hypothetical protein FACUT_3678 [Fusarium acutatum]|uniref:Uncharacterized protein n=1 Tax=Fusarium acutatum TaxID=78861 RepID=A0A8H4JW62_9HYPO|nr:hypothetical protein FACUT_3678 [Fusarium acutatum]
MSKSYDLKEPMSPEERISRQARTEDQFDGGLQTAPTLDEMATLNTSPNTRRRYSMSVMIAATDHARRQFANAYHQVRQLSEHSLAHLLCGYINGVFDPTVDKVVNLIDSEMTVAKELTEDHVTVIVVGVGTGSNALHTIGTLPGPPSWTDHIHAPRDDPLRRSQAQRPDPDRR